MAANELLLLKRKAAKELTLTVWLHPSMKVPFKFVAAEHRFKVSASDLVVDLMEDCEVKFAEASMRAGCGMELQINVLWNVKNHKKALNPNKEVGKYFGDGDTFGVFGDIVPIPAAPISKPETEKVPVTILTGFLGSGKTTLLNYILHEQRDLKIAIIENEFGEISIDEDLLKQDKLALAEKVISMDNGCMCCTIRGDLVKGLQSIMYDISKGSRIDAIMIETTGMADPVPIVRTFMSLPEITCELRLDAVIAMADAKNLIRRLDDKIQEGKVNEAYQQIAFADKIILNKLDLVTAEEAIEIKNRIRDVNKYAKVIPAVRSKVKVKEITNIRAHDMTNFADMDIAKEAETTPQELEKAGHGEHGGHAEHGHDEHGAEKHGHGEGGHEGGSHGSGHGGGHGSGHSSSYGHGDPARKSRQDGHNGGSHGSGHGGGHKSSHGHGDPARKSRHDARVNSFAIVKEGEIPPQKLGVWQQHVMKLPPEKGTIYRIKAIFAVKGHPLKHIFHAVMDCVDVDDAAPWAEGEKKISKIVFIGKSLDEPFLRAMFENAYK